MELLDSDIHFPKYDIRMPKLQANTTPIRKLAIHRRGLITQGWIELHSPKLKVIGARWQHRAADGY